jgi:uncharacterized membrane protein YfcA
MDPLLIPVILGAIAAGFVQGLSGFAFGLVAMAFWAWSVTPQLAGPMVVFGALLGQLVSLSLVRRSLDLRLISPFIIGGVAGVPLGAALLSQINEGAFKAAIGTLLLVWCSIMLLSGALPRITRGGRLADGAVGMIGGIMGGLGGLSGPAPTLWCTLRGWDKDTQRAIFQSFNLSMQVVTLTIYAASGLITAATLRMFLIIAPAMLVPSLLGTRAYARLGHAAFQRLLLVLLLFSGIGLLASSLPHLIGF